MSKKKTSNANAAKIDEIKKKMDEATSNDDEDDILTQVLGKDHPGWIRGAGAGVTKRKLYDQSLKEYKYAKIEARLNKLVSKLGVNIDSDDDDESEEDTPAISKTKVYSGTSGSASLAETATPKSGQGSNHQLSKNGKCKLINWNGNGEEVAKGSIFAVDPKAKVHGYTLGPDCYSVAIEELFVESIELYRSEPEFANLGDALGSTIA